MSISNRRKLFKYNTCYCSTKMCGASVPECPDIQIQYLLLFNLDFLEAVGYKPNSNTILVTVQPRIDLSILARMWFKYNTCYCSTLNSGNVRFDRHKFKYNPCYCSTELVTATKKRIPDSNTILVTVQQRWTRGEITAVADSNTILVTVQRSQSVCVFMQNDIQIQYLLLFNSVT